MRRSRNLLARRLLFAGVLGALFVLTGTTAASALSLPDPLDRVLPETETPADPPAAEPQDPAPPSETPPGSETEPEPPSGEPTTEPTTPPDAEAEGMGGGSEVPVDPAPTDPETPAPTDPDPSTTPEPVTVDDQPGLDSEPVPVLTTPAVNDTVTLKTSGSPKPSGRPNGFDDASAFSSTPLTTPSAAAGGTTPASEGATTPVSIPPHPFPLAIDPPSSDDDDEAASNAPAPASAAVADLSTFVTGQLGAATDPRAWSSVGQAAARFGPWIALLLIAFVVHAVARSALRDTLRATPARTDEDR